MSQDTHQPGFVILISVVATIGRFLFGFDSGAINSTVVRPQNDLSIDSVTTGFNVASILLGCALGAFLRARSLISSGGAVF